MNEQGNKYALAALKDRRATLAGEIADLKKQLAWRVQQLDHVDACLTIFEPGFDVAKIGTKLVRRRMKLFRQGEHLKVEGRLIVRMQLPGVRLAVHHVGIRPGQAEMESRHGARHCRGNAVPDWFVREIEQVGAPALNPDEVAQRNVARRG